MDCEFICGVVEGFYGRPWTTEQRKDLFSKLKRFGLNTFMYAPKDDFKHRAYWRELYSVEEAEQLSSLIQSAKDNGVVFYYALSPGLDITYSSSKEINCLKRKLEQVQQFGCEAFALLFDDIEPEISSTDKEMFQSFGHAQVSITNEIYSYLGQPKFLFCPTEYCGTRASPSVENSEYLNIIGSKLMPDINIMWTGNKVISKVITVSSIQILTDVLKRKPVIWDNLHANDYDQKRLYLGPYSGRSTDLITHLNGVLLNPNCEYETNFISIHTLSQWCKCSSDIKSSSSATDSYSAEVSADIKLEIEASNENGGSSSSIDDDYILSSHLLSPTTYYPRNALRIAIRDWMEEFNLTKYSTFTKAAQISAPLPAAVVGTLSSNTTTTTTATLTTMTTTTNSNYTLPNCTNINDNSLCSATLTTQVEVTNDVDSELTDDIKEREVAIDKTTTVSLNRSNELLGDFNSNSANNIISQTSPDIANNFIPITKDLINSLVNPPIILNPLEPMDCNSSPNLSPKHSLTTDEEQIMEDPLTVEEKDSENVKDNEDDNKDSINLNEQEMQTEPCDPNLDDDDTVEADEVDEKSELIERDKTITIDDVSFLVDLFYLPFEHGNQGLLILNEFQWLKSNSHVTSEKRDSSDYSNELTEWLTRADKFNGLTKSVNKLFTRLNFCKNRSLYFDLYQYVWDIKEVISLLNSYVKWLALGKIPSSVPVFISPMFTWFSKGYKEAFTSGDQEPWLFRGGLISELQRLLPVESVSDLFLYKAPDSPSSRIYTIRPYLNTDEPSIYNVYRKSSEFKLFNDNYDVQPNLSADKFFDSFLSLSSEYCFVVEDENGICGYVLAALDSQQFHKKIQMTVFGEKLCSKYSATHNNCKVIQAEIKNKNETGNIVDQADNQDIIDDDTIVDENTSKEETNNHLNTNEEQLDENLNELSVNFEIPELVYKNHPSMIRINLLQNVMDFSVPKRLLACVLAALKANGSHGVFSKATLKDKHLIDFYLKLGFHEIQFPTEVRSVDEIFLGRII